MPYGIIADDLTGSCDVAARLTLLGYRPVVQLRLVTGDEQFLIPGAAIVVANSRSRDCRRREAVARAWAWAELLERSGAPVIYQKIDSTLRGQWPEELRAIAALTQPDRVLICPAFPARGRFIEDGRLRMRPSGLEGPLGTVRSKAPDSLMVSLRKRCGWKPQVVKLDTVRRGASAMRRALTAGKRARCVVFDATRESHLQAIARAAQEITGRSLWVGSAGLVRYALPLPSERESARDPLAEGPWLLVQGSRQPTSRRQFRRLAAEERVHGLNFATAAGGRREREWYDAAIAALAAGKNVAVTTPETYDSRLPGEFARFLRKLLLLTAPRLAGVFVTGGNTAEATCDSLEVRAIRVVEEIRPGIARGFVLNGRHPGLTLVTKAGGFGEPGEVWEVLMRLSRARAKREGPA